MVMTGNEACQLFGFATGCFMSQDEYDKAIQFLDHVTPAQEKNFKRETESDIKSILESIINMPESQRISVIHNLLMSKSDATRAYFVCWLGEASENLMEMGTLPLPKHSAFEAVLKILLQSDRSFWRGTPDQ